MGGERGGGDLAGPYVGLPGQQPAVGVPLALPPLVHRHACGRARPSPPPTRCTAAAAASACSRGGRAVRSKGGGSSPHTPPPPPPNTPPRAVGSTVQSAAGLFNRSHSSQRDLSVDTANSDHIICR